MNQILINILIKIIKGYKYIFSPLLGNKCRYLPTCSEFFIQALESHGLIKGLFYGLTRILSCNPVKFLGGGSGINLVPIQKGNQNG